VRTAVPVRAMLHSLKMWARAPKRDVHAIDLAAHDARERGRAASGQRGCGDDHHGDLDFWRGDIGLGWIFLLAPTEPGHGASLIAFDVWQRKSRHAHWNRHSRSWASTMSACAILGSVLPLCRSATCRPVERRSEMSWRTPKIIEVPVGMEINMYACAARK
jgi:coenzyme PQQ precursor peptide PqqA